MIFPRERSQNFKMDYEDSDASFGNGLQEDYLNYADSSGITSLPIQQPVIQPIAQPIVQPIVQPVAPVVAPQPEVQPVIQQQPLTPPPVVEQVAQEENTGVFGLPSVQPPPVAQPVQPAAPAGPDPKSIDALTNQILGQGLTGKWSGEGFGSAEKNAADMAKILAGIGITDIKEFGKITKTIPGYSYETEQGTVDVPEQVVQTYGNKATGQEVPNTYSERQSGNFFGGTFSGKGNTGYGVQFDSQGNPIFYTQGASSNDLANLIKDLGPIGQIALAAATGGMSLPAQLATNAGIQLLAGGNLGDIVKGTALSYLGGQAGNLISGSSGITDLLGKAGTDVAARTTQQFVGSGGKADIGQALLGNVVGSGVNSVIGELPGLDNLSATDKNLTSNLIAAVATGTPIDQAIQNALVGKASSEARSAVAEVRNAAPAPQTYEEMMAGITPKMPDQPSVDTGPSNDEILKQIGYEPEPATGSQEPVNVDELLRQLEPLKEPAINVAEQQAAAERIAQEQAARERAYQEQADRDTQERQAAAERQAAIDRANAEAEKQVVPEPTPEPTNVTELLRQIQPEPVVEPVAQPVAEEPVAQPTVTEEPANISQLLRELNPYAEPTQEGRTLPQEVPQITQEPKAQELPFNIDSILQTLSEPVASQPVALPSPNEDFAPTVTEPAQEMTVQQEPEDLDSLLAALNLSQAPDAQPSSDLSESELDSLKLMNLISAGGEDTSTTEPSTQASDSLINQAATDTLGTKTQNAEEPAVEKDKAMDGIDFSQVAGDYGPNLLDEIRNSMTDTGNASSLFSGDGGIDLSALASNVNDDGTTGGILELINNFKTGEEGDSTLRTPDGIDESFANSLSPEEYERYLATLNPDYVSPLAGTAPQDLGISQEMMDEFNKNYQPAGGFGSQWQTVGTNRVMIHDDGTASVLDPTTKQTSYLDEDQVKALVKNGTLNSKGSGYVGATGGKGTTPGGAKPSTAAKTAAKTGTSPGTNNTGLIMALMAMMAMMNSKGGGSSAASTIPALSANRTQLPYGSSGSASARPGAGGVNYFSPMSYTAKAAEGGLMGLAGGGMSNLGGYSDGGRLLKGPGDGVSDSIPATIGGKQPARLATGEFVVPARIVSELGNGSTEAGAKKLYAMMDRVQKARRKTKNVAADTKAHKYLPA